MDRELARSAEEHHSNPLKAADRSLSESLGHPAVVSLVVCACVYVDR